MDDGQEVNQNSFPWQDDGQVDKACVPLQDKVVLIRRPGSDEEGAW